MIYEEFDFTPERSEEFYQHKRNNNLSHNVKMWIGLGLVFIIGGLQALKGNGIGDFSALISILLMGEHFMEGNTN